MLGQAILSGQNQPERNTKIIQCVYDVPKTEMVKTAASWQNFITGNIIILLWYYPLSHANKFIYHVMYALMVKYFKKYCGIPQLPS
jgi:hypothetical protein